MGIVESFMGLSYFLIILIVAAVATIITTLIYKFTTNQEQLRKNKQEIKDLREKMTKNKKDQKKMMEIQQQMMAKNMEMMKASFKPMIYTFIPLIIMFSWMTSTIAFEPLKPGEEFTLTANLADAYPGVLSEIKVTSIPEMSVVIDKAFIPKEGTKQQRWILKAEQEGKYTILLEGDTFKQTKEVIISNQKKYAKPISDYKDSQLKQVVVGNAPVRPLGSISLLGWRPGWLGTYIILSIIMSVALRKALKIA